MGGSPQSAGTTQRSGWAEVEDYAAFGVTEVQVMPDRHPVAFVTEVAESLLPPLSSIG